METFHIVFRMQDDQLPTGENFKATDIIQAYGLFKEKYPAAQYILSYAVDEKSGKLKY